MRIPSKSLPLILGLTMLLMPAAPAMATQSSSSATVTIVHGLPHFTADIYVNGKLLLDGFKPKSEAGPLKLPPGLYHLAIRDVGASSSSKPALKGSARLQAGADYSIVAHLDDGGAPALSVYRNAESPVTPGRARIIIRAVATLPPVTLEANGEQLFSEVAPGEEASTLISPGSYKLKVFTQGKSGSVFPVEDLRLREGYAYALYLVGSGSDHSLDLIVQALQGLGSAPSGVESGTGGLADHSGVPTWVIALEMAVGVALLVAGIGLRRRAQHIH
jgi:Domain of unknown function (DUF4397)